MNYLLYISCDLYTISSDGGHDGDGMGCGCHCGYGCGYCYGCHCDENDDDDDARAQYGFGARSDVLGGEMVNVSEIWIWNAYVSGSDPGQPVAKRRCSPRQRVLLAFSCFLS